MKIYSCGCKIETKYKRVIMVPFECRKHETAPVKRVFDKLEKVINNK